MSLATSVMDTRGLDWYVYGWTPDALLLWAIAAWILSRGGREDGDTWARRLAWGGVGAFLLFHGAEVLVLRDVSRGLAALGTKAVPGDMGVGACVVLRFSLVGWLLLGGSLLAGGCLLVSRRWGRPLGLAALGAVSLCLAAGAWWPAGDFEARWTPVLGHAPSPLPCAMWDPADDPWEYLSWQPAPDPLGLSPWGMVAGWLLPMSGAVVALALVELVRAGRGWSPLVLAPTRPLFLGCCTLALSVSAARVEWMALERAVVIARYRWYVPTLAMMQEDWLRSCWPAALVGWLAFLALLLGFFAWWNARRGRKAAAPMGGETEAQPPP